MSKFKNLGTIENLMDGFNPYVKDVSKKLAD